ncbi:variant erythrocyte surface antigen-1 beta subunit [Babesia bovis T2Bo]|uniref:variant erythrocyte surface antigen-1 beta subunit n=1 Tax=Babesia bovis T2Bo TaxID=484906 RepID=UPI001DD3C243|nr:variant erythrocyte surface antigen-1 beta subunit [Babesia bovis T2Bo]EDO05880.2 variant erythrocyte surface antigen-1 beta subunit [Babesia bovis T2Bo]
MYANGLFGFDMEGSAAQCLDQLRVYVYHCFYQLYFLRKQCSTGVVEKTVLGWQSCRYGKGVSGTGTEKWICEAPGAGIGDEHTKQCGLPSAAGSKDSPLMSFLCDTLGPMRCQKTVGKSPDSETNTYPEIDAHMNKTVDSKGIEQPAHMQYPQLCSVPMGWQSEIKTSGDNHFKDLNNGTHKTEQLTGAGTATHYPAHCTGNTLSLLLEYYCDPEKCHGTLVVLLRLLACITPTVPRTLGDLFGFYYYIVNMADQSKGFVEGVSGKYDRGAGAYVVIKAITASVKDSIMGLGYEHSLKHSLSNWGGNGGSSTGGCKGDTLKCLTECDRGNGAKYLSPLSGQQYGQLSPLMAGTYLSWLVYLIENFEGGLRSLESAFKGISCKESECRTGGPGGAGAGCGESCKAGTHGNRDTCCCTSVVSCTGVLPVLYKYGFGYGNVTELHTNGGPKKCDAFLTTLNGVKDSSQFNKLVKEINQLIYTTRLPWIFVLTLAWLVAVLYLAFGALWPLDWTHMRSHCRGWFRKGSLSPWEILMVGKKKGRGILEFFGGK